jgi:AcrR family transcriptional regulator
MTTPQRLRLAALSDSDRARWLDPAETEFCAKGFERASLNRILSAAGESKGRTYHYFADKAELFRATLERRFARHTALHSALPIAAATSPDQFWPRAESLAESVTQALATDPQLAALVRCLHREPAARQAFAAPLAALKSALGTWLTTGQAAQAVRSDLPLSLLGDLALDMLASIDRWFAENAETLSRETEAELSRRAFAMLKAAFLPFPPDESALP